MTDAHRLSGVGLKENALSGPFLMVECDVSPLGWTNGLERKESHLTSCFHCCYCYRKYRVDDKTDTTATVTAIVNAV